MGLAWLSPSAGGCLLGDIRPPLFNAANVLTYTCQPHEPHAQHRSFYGRVLEQTREVGAAGERVEEDARKRYARIYQLQMEPDRRRKKIDPLGE
jgi:hypothetical protein